MVAKGPCHDAIRENGTIRVDDMAPKRAGLKSLSAACSELGMHSMLAQVLPVDDQVRGAVNISARQAFDAQDEKVIAILGSAAVTAMRAVWHQEKSDHMERALHISRRIGVVLGILMVTRGLDLTAPGLSCPRRARGRTPRSPSWPTRWSVRGS